MLPTPRFVCLFHTPVAHLCVHCALPAISTNSRAHAPAWPSTHPRTHPPTHPPTHQPTHPRAHTHLPIQQQTASESNLEKNGVLIHILGGLAQVGHHPNVWCQRVGSISRNHPKQGAIGRGGDIEVAFQAQPRWLHAVVLPLNFASHTHACVAQPSSCDAGGCRLSSPPLSALRQPAHQHHTYEAVPAASCPCG